VQGWSRRGSGLRRLCQEAAKGYPLMTPCSCNILGFAVADGKDKIFENHMMSLACTSATFFWLCSANRKTPQSRYSQMQGEGGSRSRHAPPQRHHRPVLGVPLIPRVNQPYILVRARSRQSRWFAECCRASRKAPVGKHPSLSSPHPRRDSSWCSFGTFSPRASSPSIPPPVSSGASATGSRTGGRIRSWRRHELRQCQA
jgi:hypothetical protein